MKRFIVISNVVLSYVQFNSCFGFKMNLGKPLMFLKGFKQKALANFLAPATHGNEIAILKPE